MVIDMALNSNTGQTRNFDTEQLILKTLERVRLKLLDLSRRNTLLNFRETKRSIRIIDELPEETYKKLVTDNVGMQFLPTEPPEEIIEDQYSSEEQMQLTLTGEIQSESLNNDDQDEIELPKPDIDVQHKYIDKYLQTPFLDKELERRCKNVLRNWKIGIDEAGINYLYLSMGFLEWHDAESSDIINRAPLILIPLRIERNSLNKKSQCYNYSVHYSGEDIEINITLQEKLERDFNLTLPTIDENFSVEKYFAESKAIFDKFKGWRVVREMIVGFFSFAKLRLYKDLDPNSWPNKKYFTEHPNLRDILIGKDKSVGDGLPSYTEEHEIDGNPSAEAIPLVMDADSSQHSAIIDVVVNKDNLVIEGPPGTGKSQTISNIIASSLSDGNSVLFVSEKKAALEVVRNRLNTLGLGAFCLELHSHKTQKGNLHKDIANRLDRTFTDIRILDSKKEQFKLERERLQKVYNLLHKKPSATNESIYEILGASEKWKFDIKDQYFKFDIPDPLRVSFYQLTITVSSLEDYSKVYKQIPSTVKYIWSGYEPVNFLPGDDEAIKSKIGNVLSSVNESITLINGAVTKYNFPMAELSIKELNNLANVNIAILMNISEDLIFSIAPNLISHDNYLIIDNLNALFSKYFTNANDVKDNVENYESLSLESLAEILEACEKLSSLNFDDEYIKNIRTLIGLIPKTHSNVKALGKALGTLSDFIILDTGTFEAYDQLECLYKILEDAPPELSVDYHKEHGLTLAQTYFNESHAIFSGLVGDADRLSKYFRIEKALLTSELNDIAEIYSQYQGKFKRFFSGIYLKNRKILKSIIVGNTFQKNIDYANLIKDLVTYLENVYNLKNNKNYKKVLGPVFEGIETNWELLSKLLIFSNNLRDTLNSENCAVGFLGNFLVNKEKVNKLYINTNPIQSQIKSELNSLNYSIQDSESFDAILEWLSITRSSMGENYNRIPKDFRTKDIKICELSKLLENAILCKDIEKRVNSNDQYKELLGCEFKGIHTNIEAVVKTANWVQEIKAKSGLNTLAIDWLLEKNIPNNILLLKSLKKESQGYTDHLSIFTAFIKANGVKDLVTFFNTNEEIDNILLTDLSDTLSQLYDTTNYLMQWTDFITFRNEIEGAGLMAVINAIDSGDIDIDNVKAYYLHSLYYCMMIECMKNHVELAKFVGVTYDNLRERLSKLDKEILNLNRQRIAYQISLKDIPQGVGSGYVRDYTDLSLVEHELHKQKRHIPIRQLVKRAGQALQAIKPCFMMSPQSVAQYLKPGQIYFDMVVMDEASQLKLEDAIGAIARTKQVVVVGDPKQLPPSSFFDRIKNTEIEDDETTAAEEAESILDVCQNCFFTRRLRWHYRSEHDDLIAFSNNDFYDDDLIVFPSPFRRNNNFGVYYRYIENAMYYKGKNVKEARVVALAIKKHFEENEDLSLGVATFNIQQRNLIFDELERLQKEHSWLEALIKNTEDLVEPFFIKNLENVQGDERDVIFISTTYGPDKNTKKVYQRFGPLNSEMGWRRLNVIITRAKKRVVVFSSMKPTDILTGDNTARGAVALKRYLEFAKTNNISDYGTITDREPDSDFEIAVSKAINQHGYKTAYQVGVAGFFIDIGVYNPNREGEFVLGIECDGAAYHSAKSIRDRDILRQRVLENKGWKIHRIWSTDWFKDQEKQLEKVLNLLHRLVVEDDHRPDFAQDDKVSDISDEEDEITSEEDDFIDEHVETSSDTADMNDKLQEELINYRKAELDPITKDLNNSLLSEQMIHQLIMNKPISRSEFLDLPLSIRELIEPGQMDYIDDIFEIIEEYV